MPKGIPKGTREGRMMVGQATSWLRAIIGIAVLVLELGPYSILSMANPLDEWPTEFREDADLHGVFFLDAQTGWAVGDRGAIWQTTDGGQRWQLQPAPVGCRLNAIYFLDRRRGWIVGGWTQPYTHRSRGVVLRTESGGQQWTRVKNLELPELRGVHFVDAATGYAAGFGNPLYPSGCFVTSDGGRSWQTVSSDTAHNWTGVAFMGSGSGLLVSSRGAVASLRNRQLKLLREASPRFRRFRNLAARQDGPAVLVGDGGLVIATDNGGQQWSNLTANLPGSISQQFDFHAVETSGTQMWVAGTPGTVVMRSANGGRSWETHETGQTLPLEDLRFVDRNIGWAVGAQGTILKTIDGGARWTIQHAASERVALLGVFASIEEVPTELFGQTSAVLNYRSRCLVVGVAQEDHDSPHVSAIHRAHEAIVQLGGSGANTFWGFRLPEAGLSIANETIATTWSRDHKQLRLSPAGTEQLCQRIASAVRQWKPSIVVTTKAGSLRLGLLAETVRTAIEKAGDPSAFPELERTARLLAWQVTGAVAVAPGNDAGQSLRIEADEISTSLAKPLSDLSKQAKALVTDSPVDPVISYSILPIVGDIAPKSVQHMFQAAGIRLTSDQRRRMVDRSNVDIEGMRRAIQRTENVHAILSRAANSNTSADAWLGQVDDLIGNFGFVSNDLMASGDVLLRLIGSFRESGQMDTAVQLMEMFTERFPEHPALEAAILDMISELTSTERRHHRPWTGAKQANPLRISTHSRTDPANSSATEKNPFVASGPEPSSSASPRNNGGLELKVSNQSMNSSPIERLWKLVDRMGPRLAAEPMLQMQLAAMNRSDRSKAAIYRTDLKRMAASLPDTHWRACAWGELWLAGDEQQIYKPIIRCGQASAPHLDGIHDDATWDAADTVELSTGGQFGFKLSSTVAVTRDGNFLYLAIECNKVDTVEYPESSRPRRRDADLSQRDRVNIYLDVNRDYSSAWRLTVDSRGWTGEALGADTSWDPTWYVASHDTPEKWAIEAAIPLDKLGGGRPRAKAAWAVGLERIAPGAGRQSWPLDMTSAARGERFGYLSFE